MLVGLVVSFTLLTHKLTGELSGPYHFLRLERETRLHHRRHAKV